MADVPAVHRAVAAGCSHVRGAGNFDPTLMFASSKSDAACTAGTIGRCLGSMGGAQTNRCSYDGCFLDSECSGKFCTCRARGGIRANRCSSGNCTTDASCSAGGCCSPSVDPDKTNYGITGWWCRTAKDACTGDTDCATAVSSTKKTSAKRRPEPRRVKEREALSIMRIAHLFMLGALVVGCRRHESTERQPVGADASSLAPFVEAVAAADAAVRADAAPPTVRMSLVVREDAKGAPRAHAVVEGLEVDEDLAKVVAPNACAARIEDGVWRVTCTPDYRKVLLSVRVTPEGLSIEKPRGPAKIVAVPSGAVLAADEQVVGERDLHPCAPDAGARSLALVLRANENVNAYDVWLQLVVGSSSVTLANMPPKCELTTEDGQATLTCNKKPTCTVSIRGAVVDIACEQPTPARGALVAPCGTIPTLPAVLERTWSHYG